MSTNVQLQLMEEDCDGTRCKKCKRNIKRKVIEAIDKAYVAVKNSEPDPQLYHYRDYIYEQIYMLFREDKEEK